MRNGRPVVFLSCSVRFQTGVAEPIRDELASNGVDAIIVSLERIPRNADWDPDTKVDKYLEQSDVFVALATPDDSLSDGTFQVRANVVDEITRAKRLPHLRDRSLVFRERSVHLHSNVNPAHEPLLLDNPSRVVPVILEQMMEWGVLASVAAPASVENNPSTTPTSTDQSPLQRAVNLALGGLKLADWLEARRRAYVIVTSYKRSGVGLFIECLTQMILEMPSDSDELHPALMLCEEVARMDNEAMPIYLIERMAQSDSFTVRASAATHLWNMSLVAPGRVPLGLLGRLARPNDEDWYVQAPAMAAAKELLLVRSETAAIFEGLALSSDPEDRRATAVALTGIAEVDSAVVPKDLVARLLRNSVIPYTQFGVFEREVSEAA